MPCNCDHLLPNKREKESRQVAEHLVYMHNILDLSPPAEYVRVANSAYGDVGKAHELTAALCEMCRNHSREAKALPELRKWWEKHRDADRKRQAGEWNVALPEGE